MGELRNSKLKSFWSTFRYKSCDLSSSIMSPSVTKVVHKGQILVYRVIVHNIFKGWLWCVFCTIICVLVFLFLAMVLSVYFQSMSLTVPLVSFVPLFKHYHPLGTLDVIASMQAITLYQKILWQDTKLKNVA